VLFLLFSCDFLHEQQTWVVLFDLSASVKAETRIRYVRDFNTLLDYLAPGDRILAAPISLNPESENLIVGFSRGLIPRDSDDLNTYDFADSLRDTKLAIKKTVAEYLADPLHTVGETHIIGDASMKILFNIAHPAQVHLFRNSILIN
jgi:hypothetical protein